MKRIKLTTRELRRQNRRLILRTLFSLGRVNRLDLSKMIDLSPATVTNVITDLIADGLVLETGAIESSIGRRRMILEPNPNYGTFIGVELGETHVRLEIYNTRLEKLFTGQYHLAPEQDTPELYIPRLVDWFQEILANAKIFTGEILGIGIGVPGIVERRETMLVYAPSWNWRGVPLLDLLQKKIPYPIYIDNGAKMMALAESRSGAGVGARNQVVVLIGTGIGAGIMVDGGLYKGASNSAGEWGHTMVVMGGRSCRCGNTGCLEAYAGGQAIIERLREVDPNSPALLANSQPDILAQIVLLAQNGDLVAQKILSDTACYLGVGIVNLINLFNPEVIIIGGWAGLCIGPYLLGAINQYAQTHALKQPLSMARIVMGKLETHPDGHPGQNDFSAVCFGSASLVLDEFLSEA